MADSITKKAFVAGTANIAAERDFNRIEIEGFSPDALERAWGQFESELGPALERIIVARSISDDDDRAYLLNLIALTAIRNPRFRSIWADFESRVAKTILDVALSSPQIWESQVRQMKAAGHEVPVSDYESIKRFHDSGQYDILIPTMRHIRMELSTFDTVLETLFQRNWRVLKARSDTGGFITSDHPCCLDWTIPEKRPFPPGHGVKGTEVLFAISPELAVIGRFEDQPIEQDADVFDVAAFNAVIIQHAERQVYARDDQFLYTFGFPDPIRKGAEVLQDLASKAENPMPNDATGIE